MACNKLRDWDTTLFRVSAGKEGRWAVPTGLRKALFVGFYAPKFYWFWGKMKYFDFIFSLTYFWWVRVNAMLKEVLPKFLLPQVLTKSWRFPVPWLNLPMSALEQWKRGDSKNGYDHQYSLYDSGKANSILKKRKSPGAAEFDEIIFKTFFLFFPGRQLFFVALEWAFTQVWHTNSPQPFPLASETGRTSRLPSTGGQEGAQNYGRSRKFTKGSYR